MGNAALKHAQRKKAEFSEVSAALNHAQKKFTDFSERRSLKQQRLTNTLTLFKKDPLRMERFRGIHITPELMHSANNVAFRVASGLWWHVPSHIPTLTKKRTSYDARVHRREGEIPTRPHRRKLLQALPWQRNDTPLKRARNTNAANQPVPWSPEQASASQMRNTTCISFRSHYQEPVRLQPRGNRQLLSSLSHSTLQGHRLVTALSNSVAPVVL